MGGKADKMGFMSVIVPIDSGGGMTIPQALREKFGLAERAVLEETPEGLVLRAADNAPIEIYTDERIAEFERITEKELKGFRIE